MAEIRTTSATGGQKGIKLARFDLIPVGPLTALAEHYGVGASKYDNHQWRNGYEWSKTYAALMRHVTAWWAGYDFDVCSNDPEGCSHVDADGNPFTAIREDACFNHTGSHHLAAVAWHAFAGLEFVERFPDHDDRYGAVVPIVPSEEPEYVYGPVHPETCTTSDVHMGLGDLTQDIHDGFGALVNIVQTRPVAHFAVDSYGTVTQNVGPDLTTAVGREIAAVRARRSTVTQNVFISSDLDM